MSIDRLRDRLSKLLREFRAARGGNVAITFAFATLPLIAFVGAAVDYSRANTVKAAMQAALDTTALMLSKEAASDTTGQLQSNAQKYFAALFTRPEAQNAAVTATYTTTGGSTIVVNGSVQVPTIFMGVVGFKTFDVDASSTVKWGSARLRVALVLDNTGSMASAGKMTALKTATKNLLNQLKTAATVDGDVYVSIIPFSKDVNVGASNYNASWIDWTKWDAQNGSCTKNHYHDEQSCSSHNFTWTPNNHSTWNGCIMDRGTSAAPGSTPDYDQKVDLPNPGIMASLFPAEQYGSCPIAMMGLNYNWSAMNSLVNQMQPKGSTNQPIGLVWGWQSLVGGGPLTAPAKDPNYKYQDVIILMSDGLNTQDRWYQAQTPVDNRMYQTGNGSGTCANIKATGVTIYTIQVNTDGDPTSTLLQNCASSSDKFYLLTSANQIISAFNAIGTSLTQLRVAK